jgi:hypothetical protein
VSWELVLSAIALLVSVAVGIRQLQIQAAQHSLQERLGAIEEDRRGEELVSRRSAEILLRVEKDDKRTQLILSNIGQAEARNITLDKSSFGDDRLMGEDLLPIAVLHPTQDFSVPLIRHWGSPSSYTVTLDWTDDSGPRTKTLVVGAP